MMSSSFKSNKYKNLTNLKNLTISDAMHSLTFHVTNLNLAPIFVFNLKKLEN